MKALVISVGSNDYLLDMEPIQRITGSGEILPVNGALDFIKGIIKFRNEFVPVLDLSKRLGSGGPAKPGVHSCFVIMKGPRGMLGLYADFARDIIELDPSLISEGKAEANGRSCSLLEVEDVLDEKEWEELDRAIHEITT